jgi:hypothetical protein
MTPLCASDCIAYTFTTCDCRSNSYFRFVVLVLEKQVLLHLVTFQNQVSLGTLFILKA